MDELKVSPLRILAVTFTNKAAQEMKTRVGDLAGNQRVRELFIGTFHPLCLSILKLHADKLGSQPGFTIYDDSHQKALIKEFFCHLKYSQQHPHPYLGPPYLIAP